MGAMLNDSEWLDGGSVTSPAGYRAGVAACGLKQDGELDLALLVSEPASAAAAVFTRNRVVAAPVIVDREALAEHGGAIRAVAANAGVANACTGAQGLAAARRTQLLAGEKLGVAAGQVLVLSTGVIGVQLPLEKIEAGLEGAFEELSAKGGARLARAIMTTDTRPKHRALKLELGGGTVVLGGVAKGAGMIHPDMATMLALITTDAAAPRAPLQAALARAVARSFNCISVDGDTSTNDTVLLLANRASGVEIGADEMGAFEAALTELCLWLAQAIVRDAEGATKFVTIVVRAAEDERDARRVARTIATSPLVKTALYGGDPNWGRVLAAAGRAGAEVDAERLSLSVAAPGGAPMQLVAGGQPADYDGAQAAALFSGAEIELRLDLGLGDGQATVWTCDLSHDYVTINSHYRT